MTGSGLIFVIEDDAKTAASVRLYLEHEGFQIEHFTDPVQALARLPEAPPRAIILDVMLPRMDGLTFCRTLRQHSRIPVLIVSARTQEEDRLRGLHLGADDYITKPFSLRELVARVHAVLRRGGAAPVGLPGFEWKQESQELLWAGAAVPLTRTELRLLQLFLESPERVFTREDIIRLAFPADFEGFDRTVDAHIRNVRRKVREAGGPEQIIATVFGTGYRLQPQS